jgi:uncharacterized protein with HEPN domain
VISGGEGGRLREYLSQMLTATTDALDFTEGMGKDAFLQDRRTQQAVVMSIIILGEAATRILNLHPDFAVAHPEIAWRAMRGMRNRIAHGYFETDFELVWETVRSALPELKERLCAIAG